MRSSRAMMLPLAVAIGVTACSRIPSSPNAGGAEPRQRATGSATSPPPPSGSAGAAADPESGGGSDGSATGRIEGVVRYVGNAPLRVKQLSNDIDVATCGERLSLQTVVLGRDAGLSNVFVELRDEEGGLPLPASALDASTIRVIIKRCALEPHVLVVPAGSSVEIQNDDGILHHLVVPALRNEPFDARLPRYRKRLLLSGATLARPEILSVGCDVHPWEVGWWVVSNNPLRALSGADGRFVIEGVPAGTWRLTAWHEDLKRAETQVTVEASRTVPAELNFR